MDDADHRLRPGRIGILARSPTCKYSDRAVDKNSLDGKIIEFLLKLPASFEFPLRLPKNGEKCDLGSNLACLERDRKTPHPKIHSHDGKR